MALDKNFNVVENRPISEIEKVRRRNNAKNQKEIIKTAVKAKENGMTYGQYVAQQYLEQTHIVRKW